ncbi:hypothetical protein [Arcanobacterium ihumii]|uniref:hypothetical protein n=1 Tax=Arcanobacterium ihumii TaxID=2138162 RepID=UPI000F539785|nr:hypothetical protein [Arcanobacterium ihumii]
MVATFSTQPNPDEIVWNEFGPWIKERAERLGYADRPITEPYKGPQAISQEEQEAEAKREKEDPAIKQTNPNVVISDKDMDRIAEVCDSSPKYPRFLMKSDLNIKASGGSSDDIPRSEAGMSVLEELKQYYTAAGYKTYDDSLGLIGIEGSHPEVIDAEQIKIALTEVECKTKINAIPRLADALAELQASASEKYANELTEQKGSINRWRKQKNI